MNEIEIFFTNYFQNFVWLGVFLFSLLPIFEGKVALSLAINEKLLGNKVMPPPLAIITCTFAEIFLTLFLLFFFKNLCLYFSRFKFFNKIYSKINEKIAKKSEKLKNKTNVFLNLFVFVAIPLPLTGVYSASLIASFLNLNTTKSLMIISLGNLVSLILVYFLSLLFKEYTTLILLLLFLIVLVLIYLKSYFAKRKSFIFLKDWFF